MKFLHYLNELAFEPADDFDFPGKVSAVLVSNPDDVYKLQGKTHGLDSHAIKHIMEFDKPFYEKVIGMIEDFLSKKKMYVLSNGKTREMKDEWKAEKVIQNTLDFVNDKNENGESLDAVEKIIMHANDALGKRYSELIEEYTEDAIDVDTLNYADIKETLHNGHTIKYLGSYHGIKSTYFYNKVKGSYAVESRNKFKTMYKPYTINRTIDFKNPAVEEYFSKAGLLKR